ncbi:MAG: M28 family peptidase [Bacteroidota bacterium]|nr:M28 family peptidase [Bacteroidota bacterium]
MSSGFNKTLQFIVLIVISVACQEAGKPSSQKETEAAKQKEIVIPSFNADSAYLFVEKQLSFGPRVPNTKAHSACAAYLEKTLNRFHAEVIVQDFKTRAYNGKVLNAKNIIASFEPEKKSRVILCAHWDSRPYADQDPDPDNHRKPILGANDGASGVGVLLEIARQLKNCKPRVGIDIILFDVEDYGPPTDTQQQDETDYWGLGSQYWARNTHRINYRANYAILLDMVGVPNPSFLMEGFSMHFAPDKVKKVWDVAEEIGYGDYFLREIGGYITDDHYYINRYRKIPAINIIHLDPESVNGSFFQHWHTLGDDLGSIDKESLLIVGNTVLAVIFRE